MTTLCPGRSFPSCSAISTIHFAILSFTDPPGEVYSSFPTEALGNLVHNQEVALLRYPIEAYERGISNCVKD